VDDRPSAEASRKLTREIHYEQNFNQNQIGMGSLHLSHPLKSGVGMGQEKNTQSGTRRMWRKESPQNPYGDQKVMLMREMKFIRERREAALRGGVT